MLDTMTRPVRGSSEEIDRKERWRSILQDLVTRRFDGNMTHAAKALGVTTGLISLVLSNSKNVGPDLIEAIADFTGISLDELYGRRPPSPATTPPDRARPTMSALPFTAFNFSLAQTFT